jgi:hypothetical protein
MTDLGLLPCEIDASLAKEELHRGQLQPLATYLTDSSQGLMLLAELVDPKAEGASPQLQLPASVQQTENTPCLDQEWVGDFYQLNEALEQGETAEVGRFLRDLSGVLDSLADTLSGRGEWKVKLVRARRGKPPRIADWHQSSRERAVQMKLQRAKAAGLNLKRVVWDLEQQYGLNRSTIYRMTKPRHKRKASKNDGN